jgi:hypothetical protein
MTKLTYSNDELNINESNLYLFQMRGANHETGM